MDRRVWSLVVVSALVLGTITAVSTQDRGPDVAPAGASTGSTIGSLSVFVGYAENKENESPDPASFPVPWTGAPDTVFLGGTVPGQGQCGPLPNCYDAGAVRLDNRGTTPVTVDSMNVDIHSSITGGKVFKNQWGSFTVMPGTSVILTENAPFKNPTYDNFDTSSYPDSCTPIAAVPTVTLFIAKVPYVLSDTTHVLDTGGVDPGSCKPKHNESIQWRSIGDAGTGHATLTLAPARQRALVGSSVVETATLLDGGGVGLPHVPVSFRVTSGPDTGATGTAVTDWDGRASFSYGGAEGEDTVVATVAQPLIGSFSSSPATVMWSNDSTTGWTRTDVGGATPASTAALDPTTGTWTLTGGGSGIGGTSDSLALLGRPLPTAGGITARVVSESGADPGARAGVMLRASTAAGAPFYSEVASPTGAVSVQYRATSGAAVTTLAGLGGALPGYLWAARTATGAIAYTSADGFTWSPVPGSAVTLDLGATPVGALVVTSHSLSASQSAAFDAVAVSSTAPVLAPPLPCPPPWSCADVGSPAPAGDQSFDPGTGTWRVTAGGADISGTSDQFRFVSQSLTGDATLSARVVSQTNTSSNAKAGVMFRDGGAPGAAEYSVVLSPGAGIKVQVRTAAGATTTKLANPAGVAPVYLRISRVGNTFTAFTSTDGLAWAPIAKSAANLALPATLLGGLAVTSHNNGVLSTVVFDGVTSGP